MAESFNKCTLVGRLTKDIEIRKSASGVSIAGYSIAVNNRKNKDGSEAPADFFNCVSFNGAAEYLANYCKKGSLILVSGRLRNRSYKNKDGQTVYVTELVTDTVQLLESSRGSSSTANGSSDFGSTSNYGDTNFEDDFSESDI